MKRKPAVSTYAEIEGVVGARPETSLAAVVGRPHANSRVLTMVHGPPAIITGAGGGLGLEQALFPARHGNRVAVNDVSPDPAIAATASVADEATVAAMTADMLPTESLRLPDPALISPGLLALVGVDASTRAILCGGAGHFTTAQRDGPARSAWYGADTYEGIVSRIRVG